MKTKINKKNKTVELTEEVTTKKVFNERQIDEQIKYLTDSIKKFNDRRKVLQDIKKELKND
jgi:hypothetical protein